MTETKRCSMCKKARPRSQFHAHPQTADRLQPGCMKCRRIRQREIYHSLSPFAKWARNIKNCCGLTVFDYYALMSLQGGGCAACKRPERRTQHNYRLVVDHDHATGEVRGLLCGNCNQALGLLDDTPEFIVGLAAYAQDPPAKRLR